jgi:hypothetical protein
MPSESDFFNITELAKTLPETSTPPTALPKPSSRLSIESPVAPSPNKMSDLSNLHLR